mgnify:CR=1 FL=1
MKRLWTFIALFAVTSSAHAQLNMYCSSPNTAWCQGMAVGFEKATGTKVAVVQKATAKPSKPIMKVRLRPTKSAMRPPSRRSPPNASV